MVVPESVALENHCTGCESAVLIQHLLRVKQWTSVRLPIDGMKSVVFEGPSPTLCVAAGEFVVYVLCVCLCALIVGSFAWTGTVVFFCNECYSIRHSALTSHRLLCPSAGNVWFDYPDHAKTGCIDQETLKRLQLKDSRERPYFDWKYSFSRYKVCLRLSEHGFANKADIFYS